MAKFSKKMMGKEVGSASVYAKPHTMNGKEVKVSTDSGKTDGIKIRGTGAATKGVTARGPMA